MEFRCDDKEGKDRQQQRVVECSLQSADNTVVSAVFRSLSVVGGVCRVEICNKEEEGCAEEEMVLQVIYCNIDYCMRIILIGYSMPSRASK